MAKRNIVHLILATAITALTASAGVFPPSEGDLAASIPFSFQVEDVIMPAGEYIIVVFEWIDDDTVLPVTAYEVPEL